jgi:xanthine/uracil/vitamin C permease (AzgA family)
MLVDGAGTCFGALFGSMFSTTVYIGHPIHKALGAKRGYSLFNGLIFFFLLNSGLFAAIYAAIPECANGAVLTFVGLLLGRQAFEETPARHYPALLLAIMPYICNWAKLSNNDPGVQMMAPAGGLLFSFVLTWVFCLCIDRDFMQASILSGVAIFMSLFGVFASLNHEKNEQIGVFTPIPEDANNGWRWALAWFLAFVFFVVQMGLQKIGYISGKFEEPDAIQDGAGEEQKTEKREKVGI